MPSKMNNFEFKQQLETNIVNLIQRYEKKSIEKLIDCGGNIL